MKRRTLFGSSLALAAVPFVKVAKTASGLSDRMFKELAKTRSVNYGKGHENVPVPLHGCGDHMFYVTKTFGDGAEFYRCNICKGNHIRILGCVYGEKRKSGTVRLPANQSHIHLWSETPIYAFRDYYSEDEGKTVDRSRHDYL